MKVKFTYKNKPFSVNLNVKINITRQEIEAYIDQAGIDIDDISIIDIQITNNREREILNQNSDLLALLHELSESPVARIEVGATRKVYSL